MKSRGEFKCPRCGWMHLGISLEDAQEQVRQAQAFYVVASKINHVTMRGPDAYLEGYKRCRRCGATSADFVPAMPGDVPHGPALQAVIAPQVWTCRECAAKHLGPSVVHNSTYHDGTCGYCQCKRAVCPADDFAERK